MLHRNSVESVNVGRCYRCVCVWNSTTGPSEFLQHEKIHFLFSRRLFYSLRCGNNTTWRSHWFSSAQNFPIRTEQHSIGIQFKSLKFLRQQRASVSWSGVCILYIYIYICDQSSYFTFFSHLLITVRWYMHIQRVEKLYTIQNVLKLLNFSFIYFGIGCFVR